MEYLTTSFTSYLNQIDFSHLLQKCLVSVIVLLAVVISLKITYSVVDRIFDGEKTGRHSRGVANDRADLCWQCRARRDPVSD